MTHTVTHTGKRADGNNGTNRLRPHPFWTKKRRKALYSKGWKALRWLVRMRSAVRICPAAPQKNLETAMVSWFFLFRVCGEQVTETATKPQRGIINIPRPSRGYFLDGRSPMLPATPHAALVRSDICIGLLPAARKRA